jgi:RNA polymerase sigma-70 factor, ECF subfamily
MKASATEEIGISRPMPPSESRPPLELVSSHASTAAANVELIAGLVAKRPSAAVELWTQYGSLVYRIAERALGSPHEAEDLTQDVFLCLFKKIPGLRDPAALRSFVVSVTIRTVKWKLRRRRLRSWISVTDTGVLPDLPVRGVDVDHALERFYRLLDRLPVEDRMVFALRRVDGMQLDDVAHAMGHSLATVKRRLRRADAELSRLMEAEPILVTFLHHEGNA